jgi:4-amino-4-deoxy-L-arabinose transferase-like glycosyltransferase
MLARFWQRRSEQQKDLLLVLLLLAATIMLYGYGMGTLSLTEPDEVFYAQTAKEMLAHHTWSVPHIFGQPQFEKPILYFFLLALGFKFLGISAAVARLWSCLFGIAGVILTYFLGKSIYNRRAGLLAGLALATSLEYLSLSRAVLTDIALCAFLAGALASFYFGYLNAKKSNLWFLLSFVLCGLATLTKGPIGILLPLSAIFVFLLLRRELGVFFNRKIFLHLLIFCAITLPWYIFIYRKFGQQFIDEFFIRDNLNRFFFVAEHLRNNTWYYYTVTTLGGFLPSSVFLVIGLFGISWRRLIKDDKEKGLLFLFCWVAVIFTFFSFAKSKLISYVFPVFPALAVFTGNYLDRIIRRQEERDKKPAAGFIAVLAFLAVIFSCLGSYGLYYNQNHHFLPNNLLAAIPLLCLGIPTVAAFILGLKRRYKDALAVMLAAIIVLVVVGETWLVKHVEPWVSSQESAGILKPYLGRQKTTLLCNKPFARALLYYTDLPVAVMDSSPHPFFAPHPIAILYTDEQVIGFLKSQPVTYCVVEKDSFEKINSWQPAISLTVISQRVSGKESRYILRVTPKG